MALWLVSHPGAGGGATLRGGNAMIVSATTAADAKAAAAAKYGGDSGGWATANTTELTEKAVTATGALTGWRFRIVIYTATPKVFELTAAGASQDTLDEIGAALATLINTDADIADAAYTAATQTLTVAAGSGGSNLGDMAVTAEVFPPEESDAGGITNSKVAIPGFIASITDEGDATDDLEVVFGADTLLVPTVKAVVST